MQTAYQPVKAEIRIPDLTSNLKVIRAQVKKPCALCAVLKADAYGHGLPGMLSLLAEKGLADMAAIGKTSEIRQLKGRVPDGGMDILLLGYSEPEEIRDLYKNGFLDDDRFIFSVYSFRQLRALDLLGKELKRRIRVHIRLDGWNSGMGLGYEDFLQNESRIFAAEGVEVTGLYAHLYSSYGEDPAPVLNELKRFDRTVRRIRPELRKTLTVHILNSPLIFRFPEYAYDMVRTGTAMYGLPTFDGGKLRPILKISARVFEVRTVGADAPLSYKPWKLEGSTRKIARIMLGYWDCPLLLTMPDVRIVIRGRLFRPADAICMDNICVDITGAEDISPGDEAVFLGEPGVTAAEIMERNNLHFTRSEYMCMTAGRLEKVYL